MVTLRQMVTEANRELAQRSRVYPRLVAQGRLTQEQADRQNERLSAIRDLLREMADAAERQVSPPLFEEERTD